MNLSPFLHEIPHDVRNDKYSYLRSDNYLCGMKSKMHSFPFKVQKISLNAGFTCPNRDGSKGTGGCTYCNNRTFNPDYCRAEKSITEQMNEGIRFFSRKYPEMKYRISGQNAVSG